MDVADAADTIGIWKLIERDPGTKEIILSKRKATVSGLYASASRRWPLPLTIKSATVDAPLLAGALALFDQNKELGLALGSTSLTLSAGGRRARLQQKHASSLPAIPTSDAPAAKTDRLRSAVAFLAACAADETERPDLLGIKVSRRGKVVVLQATDGSRRSGRCELPAKSVEVGKGGDLVPAQDFDRALSLLGKSASVALREGALLLKDNRTTIRLSLISGEKYPDVDALPSQEQLPHRFVCARGPFEVALRAATLLDPDRLVSLEVKEGKARWIIEGGEVGTFRLPAGKAKHDVVFTFSASWAEAATHLGEEVSLYYKDGRSPVLFYDEEAKRSLWVSPLSTSA